MMSFSLHFYQYFIVHTYSGPIKLSISISLFKIFTFFSKILDTNNDNNHCKSCDVVQIYDICYLRLSILYILAMHFIQPLNILNVTELE